LREKEVDDTETKIAAPVIEEAVVPGELRCNWTTVGIEAVRFHQRTGKASIVTCDLTIIDGFDGNVLKMIGGPTGYESFCLEGKSKIDLEHVYICGMWFCAGTEGRWDALYVNGIILRNAMNALGWGAKSK
jgi:hypothetical protein